jgi:hypothetical protein
VNAALNALRLARSALQHHTEQTRPIHNTSLTIAVIDKVIAELQQVDPFVWLVCSVNADGSLSLEHAAAWERAAHDHINEAIAEHDIDGAAQWVVRPAYLQPPVTQFDFLAHLQHQAEWSARTFGPGERTEGVVDHISKELVEVLQSGGALEEWVDVIILALDGAWRSGATPEQIVAAIVAKQTKNEGRAWPDWRTAEPGKAIEHVREGGAA